MTMAERLRYNSIVLGSDFGQENWNRLLATGQTDTGDSSRLIYGLEAEMTDGHWDDLKTDLQRKNLWLKQLWELDNNEYSLTFMGYDNSWNSADQIPQRAVDQGLITDLGSIDKTSGGESYRYSLSGNWRRDSAAGTIDASVYAINYGMDLWANFTYFLEPEGDQHHQVDDRMIYGWDIAWTQENVWETLPVRNTFGSQFRYDDIREVGVLPSNARQDTGVYRTDSVDQWSSGVFWDNELRWTIMILMCGRCGLAMYPRWPSMAGQRVTVLLPPLWVPVMPLPASLRVTSMPGRDFTATMPAAQP